ncbi:thymidine phosphorylase [Aquabacterium sp. A7-Y]|uniref:thymidine phosphorylase n=1 Tax=Aquabacterium sp. A7-Y TaxID=1349605 RepID=UPI00223CDFAA|nr:thymidine phosphorylase [Aquabacterium sp. A7-Y]MCW7542054.1 thymidine phosphorylase [Aquabacterium sp. A7-Y]
MARPAGAPNFLPQEVIRRKRDGAVLGPSEIGAFVAGVADGSISEAQMAAFAMAVCCRGMSRDEAVALTLAMRDSGERLRWEAEGLPGPVVDKHSTGGVGDSVSLMLGPMLAACGCYVPMISGRGLGHTGGTLDKLEAIPGYRSQVSVAQLRRVVRDAGVAIVGAGDRLAPADRRLYAVRDVTATVESVPLITASILAKKLAAGLQALVLDVKFGSGAFMQDGAAARTLAQHLVEVGEGAGLPTRALLTDMDQPLAPSAGNALELRLTLDYLAGRCRPARLDEVVLALGATLLQQCGRAAGTAEAQALLRRALDSGQAAERFARMVAGLGGPNDLFDRSQRYLTAAPLVRPVPVPPEVRAAGLSCLAGVDTRALGLVVVQLGGGRRRGGDRIDPSVGLSAIAPVGTALPPGTPVACVHAASEAAADAAVAAVQAACRWSEPGSRPPAGPVVAATIAVGSDTPVSEEPR